MEDSTQSQPRLVLRNFLSPQICKELVFIHKSCSTVGYRPNVFSTTLHHLIATNSAHLIMPIVPVRERLKDILEEHFGCEYELFVEFTGLISWVKGASIGWHSDDNRNYLKQRHFAVVCYLNSYGLDFKGGLFHFQDGQPSTIAPMIGDVLMYTADSKNIHSVSEITEGERITLTLWFTRGPSFDEDAKLISALSNYLDNNPQRTVVPIQASHNMYWFPPEQASRFESGFDLCSARLHVMGFDISLPEQVSSSSADPLDKFLKSLNEPLHLARGDEQFEWNFVNILHALQVVQFYNWKVSELKATELNESSSITPLSELQRRSIKYSKDMLVKDVRLAETLLARSRGKNLQCAFDKVSFSSAVSIWEAYALKLADDMANSFPYWREQRSVFEVVNHS